MLHGLPMPSSCAALIGVRPLQGLATHAILGEWHRDLVALAATLHAELVIAVDRRVTELSISKALNL